MSKEKWLLILAAGVALLILSFPSGTKKTPVKQADPGLTTARSDLPDQDQLYVTQLEKKVKQILKNVDGVGEVDVMIVLKSSDEKILRVDTDSSDSMTDEQDGQGTVRTVRAKERKESTVLAGSGSDSGPIVEKEIKPEVAGIVISASGGGSPVIKAEISSAMEALFDLPPHKIKVLKRVE